MIQYSLALGIFAFVDMLSLGYSSWLSLLTAASFVMFLNVALREKTNSFEDSIFNVNFSNKEK